MITSLQIRNFRGIKDVSLKELRRVNLLIGGNDTGKTSVLEALILLLADSSLVRELPTTFRSSPPNVVPGQPPVSGGDSVENFWSWLFYDREPANEINIIGETDSERMLTLTTLNVSPGNHANSAKSPVLARLDDVRPPGQHDQFGNYRPNLAHGPRPFQDLVKFERGQVNVVAVPAPRDYNISFLSVRPTDPVQDAEKYNQIALETRGEERIESIMKQVEPRLSRLRYAKLPGTAWPLVFAHVGLTRAVPSTQMGQAFNRLLHIYVEILTSGTNVLLIDVIENGVFTDSLPLIWKGLLAICEQEKVQIFATTHSRECVMAAFSAAHEREKDELSVQRLQAVNGKLEAVRLGSEHLELASEMGLEVRS